MMKIGSLGSVIVTLLFPLSVFGWWRTSSMSYYCPVVVYVDPCPIYVPTGQRVILGPMPRQAPLAAPTAAPPSAGPISTGKGSPEVTESRSYYEAFKVRPISTDQIIGDRCSLGLWNLTGRDVIVSVDGKQQAIPQGKSLKLQVGRQFVWQTSGHEALNEKVPMENSGVEIVLRR